MDAYSALTFLGTILLLGAMAAGIYVWLTYSRWSELRFRDRGSRLRSYEVAGALRSGGDDAVSAKARRAFVRALALFASLILLAVVLLELRARV